MKIAICDDDMHDAELIYDYCVSCKLPYTISIFSSAAQLLEAFESDFYDLIFLDIEMKKPDGYEVGAILAKRSPKPLIIFTTNAFQYAVQGYGIAYRFLCKPITLPVFKSVLNESLDQILPQKVMLSYGANQIILSINDILYFECLNRHIIFHLINNETLEVKDSMENMVSHFSNPYFMQIHRSFCINMNYIKSISPSDITMSDGCQLPLSRKKQELFHEKFSNFMRGN